eukprot:359236-Chlamydomonas_euryale.AAC.13
MAELERQGREVLEDAGATATVAMIGRGGQIMVANIGDSQCFLLRNKMEKELTTPHRVYGGGKHAKSEIARVQGTGAWIFDGRVCNMLAVSRAFGDWEMKVGTFACNSMGSSTGQLGDDPAGGRRCEMEQWRLAGRKGRRAERLWDAVIRPQQQRPTCSSHHPCVEACLST